MSAKPIGEAGFTLLELMLAMSLFAILSILASRTLIETRHNHNAIVSNVDLLSDQQAAYRTLRNTFLAGAKIVGTEEFIEVDLSHVHSGWLLDHSVLRFSISEQRSLLQTSSVNADV
ncbi:MAG: prepilin-type N-terminal cleavage/methylation domain-containing protein, partial [Pseudomonadota bacterium]